MEHSYKILWNIKKYKDSDPSYIRMLLRTTIWADKIGLWGGEDNYDLQGVPHLHENH